MTPAQRNVLGVTIVAAAVLIAWLSWAWSPSTATEALPDESEDVLAAPAPPPVRAVAPPPPSAATPPQPAPQPAAQPEEPRAEPERIPSPHPMSLDRARPPEAYGPLDEYKTRWANESRGAESSANEQYFRKLFDVPNIPPALIHDVSCRRSMCKLELSWRPERRLGFVVTLESSKQLYDKRVAVEPGTREEDGSYLTNLYIRLTP
jgi:hypothetical protein